MKQEQARKLILEKLSERCNFEVPDNRLSGKTLSSIGSLATVYRHLLALTETLRVESSSEARLSRRIRRDLTGRENKVLKNSATSLLTLQDDFQRNLNDLAAQIISELGAYGTLVHGEQAPGQAATGTIRATIEPLRCPSCGAPLAPPTSKFIRCNYCDTSFEIEDYLDKLGTALRPSETPAPAAPQP